MTTNVDVHLAAVKGYMADRSDITNRLGLLTLSIPWQAEARRKYEADIATIDAAVAAILLQLPCPLQQTPPSTSQPSTSASTEVPSSPTLSEYPNASP